MRASVFAFLLGLWILAPVVEARAEEPAAESAEKLSRERFKQAEIDFNLGKFAEALSGYQAAYEAKPLTAFLFNIAQCYRNLGNYERARFFYKRYMTLEPKTPNRRVVTELIAEVTRLMKNAPPPPEGRAETPAPGVTPPAEATPATSSPPPAPAPALALNAPPAASSSAPAATAAIGDPAMVTATAPPPETHRPVYKRWWFWTGLAAVVAGGVVAGVLLTRPEPSHGTLPAIDGRTPQP